MSEQVAVPAPEAFPFPETAPPTPPLPVAVDEGPAQLVREIWEGYVPTVVTLARKEIASPSTPDDIYVSLALFFSLLRCYAYLSNPLLLLTVNGSSGVVSCCCR